MARSKDTTQGDLEGPSRPIRIQREIALVYSSDRTLRPQFVFPLAERRVVGREAGEVPVDDPRVSREHFVLCPSPRGCRVGDLGSVNGTFVGGVRVEEARLETGAVVRAGGALFVYSEHVPPPFAGRVGREPGQSSLSAYVAHEAELAARSGAPVLIHGPTGAGKERIAQRIHGRGGREGRYVAVNCASIPKELVASELFGHTAGAFSGAQGARAGLFMEAQGGTLLLDEIAELPLDQQAALLRVLQEKRIRPVGSDREIAVDVRILAATHADLEARTERGAFRSDLYARLAAITIEVPPLCARREEVLFLFDRFSDGAQLTLRAAEALLLHDWPMNVRELEHAAQRARLYAQEEAVDLVHLPAGVQEGTGSCETATPSAEQLAAWLEEHEGNISHVARHTGKKRAQVYRWCRRHHLDPKRYRRAV